MNAHRSVGVMLELDLDSLERVSGGLLFDGYRLSDNFEDRRGQPSGFTPTEDGYIVGPSGEIYPDESIGKDQPDVTPWTPTEDGFVVGPNGEMEVDRSINMDQPQPSPLSQDERDFMSATLNNQLSPTEDGFVVGPQGQVWDDPTINDSQPVEPTQHSAGDYVRDAWDDYNDGYDYAHDRDVYDIQNPSDPPYSDPDPVDVPTIDPDPVDIPTIDPDPVDVPTIDPDPVGDFADPGAGSVE